MLGEMFGRAKVLRELPDCHRLRGRLEKKEMVFDQLFHYKIRKLKIHSENSVLTTAAGFISDLAESERSSDASLAKGEIAVGPKVRFISRGLWVTGWHHVKLSRSNSEKTGCSCNSGLKFCAVTSEDVTKFTLSCVQGLRQKVLGETQYETQKYVSKELSTLFEST